MTNNLKFYTDKRARIADSVMAAVLNYLPTDLHEGYLALPVKSQLVGLATFAHIAGRPQHVDAALAMIQALELVESHIPELQHHESQTLATAKAHLGIEVDRIAQEMILDQTVFKIYTALDIKEKLRVLKLLASFAADPAMIQTCRELLRVVEIAEAADTCT